MKTIKKLKKILAVSLIMAICVALLPTSAFALDDTSSFEKTIKLEKKTKIKIFGRKTRVKLKFGTIKVKGYYDLKDENDTAHIKVYFGGKLITEGEVDKDGGSIGRGFIKKVKGLRFRITPCVKYYPAWGWFGITVNVKGLDINFDYDVPVVAVGTI